ncbi:hypothetical protein D9M68_725700 [compost metagenome]
MAHDAAHPAAAFTSGGVEGGGAVPDRHEGVVQHVLGGGVVAHDAHGHAHQEAVFAFVEALQGALIAPGAGRQRGVVVERRGVVGGHGRRSDQRIDRTSGTSLRRYPTGLPSIVPEGSMHTGGRRPVTPASGHQTAL